MYHRIIFPRRVLKLQTHSPQLNIAVELQLLFEQCLFSHRAARLLKYVNLVDRRSENFSEVRHAVFLPLVHQHRALQIRPLTLEILLELVLKLRRLLELQADLAQRLLQLRYVTSIVLTVIVQHLARAHLIVEIAVKLPSIHRLLVVKRKRIITSPAPDQLRLADRRRRYFFTAGLTRLVQPNDVKQIQHVPTFVELVHLKDRPIRIVRLLQIVEHRQIIAVVGRYATILLKLYTELRRQLLHRHAQSLKVLECRRQPFAVELRQSPQPFPRQIPHHLDERLHVILTVFDQPRLEQNDRLDVETMRREHTLAILAQHARHQLPFGDLDVRLERHDVLRPAVAIEFRQLIIIHDLIEILRADLRIGEIARRRELQQHVVGVRLEYIFHRRLPRLPAFVVLLALRLNVQMMRLVGDQHQFILSEVLNRHRVLARLVEQAVELLNRREADVDRMLVGITKIVDRADWNALAVYRHRVGEQIFARAALYEIRLRLVEYVFEMDEEQKVSVAPSVEVNHQRRHDHRLARARRHVEQHLRRALPHAFVLEIRDKVFERRALIISELVFQIAFDERRQRSDEAARAYAVQRLI